MFTVATELEIMKQSLEAKINQDNIENKASEILAKANKMQKVALKLYADDLKILNTKLTKILVSLAGTTTRNDHQLSQNRNYTNDTKLLCEIQSHLILFEKLCAAIASQLKIDDDFDDFIKDFYIPVRFRISFHKDEKFLPERDIKNNLIYKEKIYTEYNYGTFRYLVGNFNNIEKVDSFINQNAVPVEDICISKGALRVFHNYPNRVEESQNFTYRIQVAAFDNEVIESELPTFDMEGKKLICDTINGMYKYFIGEFKSFDNAEQYQTKHRLSGSFIIKYSDE